MIARTAYITEDCVWIHPGGPIWSAIAAINKALRSEIRKSIPEYRYAVYWRYPDDCTMSDVSFGGSGAFPRVSPLPLYTGTDGPWRHVGRPCCCVLHTFIDSGTPPGSQRAGIKLGHKGALAVRFKEARPSTARRRSRVAAELTLPAELPGAVAFQAFESTPP